MKNAETKPNRHLENKSKDYLLTLTLGEVSRKLVWNDQAPLSLEHPKGWVLAKIGNSLTIYDDTETNLEKRSSTKIMVAADRGQKTNVNLPPAHQGHRHQNLALSVFRLEPIPPPYNQIGIEGRSNSKAPLQVSMYHGIRYFLLKYRPVGQQLTASSSSEQIFTYSRLAQGYSVTALTKNLVIKSKGKKQVLPLGIPQLILEDEFFSSVLIQGIYWWRFRAVVSPDAQPPLEEDESEDNEREVRRFRVTTQSVLGVLTFLLMTAYTYNYFYPQKAAPVITKIELKTPKVIPHQEIAEAKPSPTPVPVPTPAPIKEVAKKEPPKEKPKPEKIVKKELPKPKTVAKKTPVRSEKPKKSQVTHVAEKTPVAPPPAPAHKAPENPPNPGVVAKKMDAPPAPDENAQILKSLSFLSSGSKNSKKGGVANYDKATKKDYMSAPALGGGSKDSNVLDKLSASTGDTNIKTRSSRSITADTGFDAPKGKGLNEVQGKVSLTELYGKGSSGGGGFNEGTGVATSGPGHLSESEIEKALAKFIGRFQFCYEKSLLTDSSLGGNIRLQWDITTSGKASAPKVLSSQMNNEGLHRCILNVLKEIPFPQPKGGPVTAKKTFSFKSSTI